MRIRTQLIALVSGIAIPLVLLAGFVTFQLWQQQRDGYEQKFLERASAVRLALDTEFDLVFRTLRTIGDATDIPSVEADTVLHRRFRRVLDNFPEWVSVALTDADGRVIMVDKRSATLPAPAMDDEDIRRTMSASRGYVSNVIVTPDGRHIVFVATSIVREGKTQGVIYVAIQHTHWLNVLRAYPVSKRGTLTLIDRQSKVIARTLNDQLWAGKTVPSDFWARTVGNPSGAFKTTSIDGKFFYVAFSRSATSDWILSTGVPEDEVAEALRWQTLAVILVAAIAVLGALWTAWRRGKAINKSFVGLLHAANALGADGAPAPVRLPIREARAVRDALDASRAQLHAREASLNASLAREAVARREAESASRTKDQFLAMMGHELRNPLSAITSAVEVLGTPALPPAALVRSRDIVRRHAGHLASMINNLMDLAQLDSGQIVLHKTRLDLAKMAANVVARFEETGRCAHLQMRTAHAPAWLDGDETRVELIITCLLDNACKYTPPGGTVVLEVFGEPDASVLRVQDMGVGIPPEVAAGMFDTFTQGKREIERSEGGLGLGLALVRKLIDLHGGAVSAFSAGPGQGATFTVRFPGAQAPLHEDTPAAAAADDLLLTIVEDIAENREMLQLLLESQGRRVNAAADGPSGVQAILEGPSDVAVVDIGLPGFDGFEVARRVRQAPDGNRVLLIALTGYGTEADRIKAIAAGFDDFLVKPFDPDRFETAVSKGLAAKSGAAGGKP